MNRKPGRCKERYDSRDNLGEPAMAQGSRAAPLATIEYWLLIPEAPTRRNRVHSSA